MKNISIKKMNLLKRKIILYSRLKKRKIIESKNKQMKKLKKIKEKKEKKK